MRFRDHEGAILSTPILAPNSIHLYPQPILSISQVEKYPFRGQVRTAIHLVFDSHIEMDLIGRSEAQPAAFPTR